MLFFTRRVVSGLELSPTEPLKILELRHRPDHRREGSKPRATDHFEYRFASSKAASRSVPRAEETPFVLVAINVVVLTGKAVFAAIDLCIAKLASKMADRTTTMTRPRCHSQRLLQCVVRGENMGERTAISGRTVNLFSRCIVLMSRLYFPQRKRRRGFKL